jgi:hypothetical protein
MVMNYPGRYSDKTSMSELLAELQARDAECEALWEIISHAPEKWNLDTLLLLGKRILQEYPDDSVVSYVVALRRAIATLEIERCQPSTNTGSPSTNCNGG